MSSHHSSGSNKNIHNPYVAGRAKRQRTDSRNDPQQQQQQHPHNRCVLLFDMDCFYAQCERVRLGLPLDVKLCLFQWNSVLAVTYPAREHGIKRGDSWDDVAAKMKNKASDRSSNGSNHECYTIHLPILGHDAETDPAESNNDQSTPNDTALDDDSIEASYRRIFQLSKEEQLRCQKVENGRRRFHHQGKACLERYRLASMRIFGVVLESLQKRITHQCGYSFVLERASIDEFYLDLTDYCYRRNQAKDFVDGGSPNEQERHDEMDNKTVVAGRKLSGNGYNTDDPLEIALNRACRVSHWIRQDIWKILGFTMSAGISTNKTMAKLAASYGKPNGQAVLYPNYFPSVLEETKITKVRNFGGKLGKTVLKLLLQYQQQQVWNNNNAANHESDADALERLKSTATMGDLNQIPLPFLLHSKSLSEESARFVFFASQGIDHEKVKETSGALVKSITAFKSFTATKSHAEIFDRWLNLLSTEIVERVARDALRNKRYPKSCTLNYTYYTTSNGHRPSTKSTRSQRQSRSLRLRYPSEREGTKQQKSTSLLDQAKAKLVPIVKEHPLRGVGLSVSNFIASSVHQSQHEGSIQSFFASKRPAVSSCELSSSAAEAATCATEPRTAEYRDGVISDKTKTFSTTTSPSSSVPTTVGISGPESSKALNPSNCQQNYETIMKKRAATLEDKDLDFARKLQASFDRENYVLSTANRRQKSVSTVKKNTPRIDAFFLRKR